MGYATGSLAELVDGNDALKQQLVELKLLKDDREVFRGRLVIPLFDEQKTLVNVLGLQPRALGRNGPSCP